MKFTDEQIVSLQSITGRYSEDHSYSFEMLCDDIESILTPPVQDGGEGEDELIADIFEKNGVDIDLMQIEIEYTYKNIINSAKEYAQLRTTSLRSELDEAKQSGAYWEFQCNKWIDYNNAIEIQLAEAKREIERLKEDSVKESTWPVCDVEGCNQKSVSGGNCWRENGYWSVCSKHSQSYRNGEPQPFMKPTAIVREKSRQPNGTLPNKIEL